MERIIYSPRNLNFCIWPGIENHTSSIPWWKISKGCGYETQDVIKIDIIDMQLQCKVNEIVILSFLFLVILSFLSYSKNSRKTWRIEADTLVEITVKMCANCKLLKTEKKQPNLVPKAFLCLTELICSAGIFPTLFLLTQKKKTLKIRLANINWFLPLASL